MEQTIKTKSKIGSMQGMLMIAVAAVVDGVNIILFAFFGVGIVANRFITIFMFMTFAFWFILNGVSFLSGRMSVQKMFRFFGASFGEIIPVIGALPLWTPGIWLTLRSVRKEEEMANISV